MSVLKEFLPNKLNKIIELMGVSLGTYTEFMETNDPVNRYMEMFCQNNKGFYDPTIDYMVINESYPDDTMETVLHELIHATGHLDRLNRISLNEKFPTDKDFHTEEVTAYLGTLKLADYFNLDLIKYGNSTLKNIERYSKANFRKAERESDKAVDYLLNLINTKEIA